jgi:outer membrane lipoprotein SlyB
MQVLHWPESVRKCRAWHIAGCALPLAFVTGCSSMNNTESGALTGGVLGAGVGAIAGAACRNPAAGAAIGAGIGAVTGGLLGHSADKAEQKAEDQAAASLRAQMEQQKQGVQDIATLAQQHVSDPILIQQIRTAGIVYRLSAEDIQFLKGNGVSDPVILAMQETANAGPVAVAQPVYVVRPAPPPVAIGFRYGYWR